MVELERLVSDWLEWNVPGSPDHQAVQELWNGGQTEALAKMMNKRLKFGTAGIRGPMGPGFSQLNDLVLIQTSQGLAHYVLEASESPDIARSKGVVIGFDARFHSHRWAKLCAGVFLRQGFTVRLFSRITPTPFVPFTVQTKGAAVGIMITASHNPKEDNGYKVFWSNGPQIKPPHDTNIQKSILNHLKPSAGEDSFSENFVNNFVDSGKLVDPVEEISDAYFGSLQKNLFNRKMNENLSKPVVYTAVHGVGANYIDRAVEVAGFKPLVHVMEQREPDPTFPTVKFPNPEEGKSCLDLAMRQAEKVGSIYILANDPDADRLAIAEFVDGHWKVFTGNEIGALLGWWQFQVHMTHNPEADKQDLYFIASTVSSKMLRSIAREEGLNFEETLTGFKWMANRSYDLERDSSKRVLLAYEEAIGFMCGTRVLDKDGVSAAIRTLELIAFLSKRNMTLAEKLMNLHQVYGYHCSENSYFIIHDFKVVETIFHRLRNFGQPDTYPTHVGPYPISSVRDLTTGFDSSTADRKATLPVSEGSEMITFQLENGTVLTIRTSGTEPKLKYYAEYCAKPEQKDWNGVEAELSTIVQHLISELIQPEQNGLHARST